LPVELPEYVQTTGNPLAAIEEFVETTCPDCGNPARRETDTMDTFVDSSWYFLRFLSPDYEDGPFDTDRANAWMPIDAYVGGEEHAILHLLYIRFVTRALCDLGLLDVREPVRRLINQGMVLHGGEKMAKSRGNVVAPHEYGAETTRLFVLSAAHPEQDFEWTAKSVGSAYDFQQTLYRMVREFTERGTVREERASQDAYVEREIDRTVAAVTQQYEGFRFHRAITEVQQLARLLRRYREYATPHVDVYRRGLTTVTLLIAPIVPFLGEELWNTLRGDGLVAEADWPVPERDVSEYRIERRLVQVTLEDVRDITEMVDIEEPAAIELVVAPDWKYQAYAIARDAEPGSAVVGQIMADDAVAAHGEAAADYAADLQDRQEGLPPVLSGERELTLLEQAAWLLDDEFGADVTVRRADGEDDLGKRARPGKPAIHIS
ncbi:MAG: class I tRNA ligase family protein, partial [Halobacteriales archaeon]|nr:class I tRNA ligase family protein [Halobacteriales archaeon]